MEAEREKFREYVEKSGLLAALTNILITLYEEPNKPDDALEYVKENLGIKNVDIKRLEMLENKVKELEIENKGLKEQLENFTAASSTPTASESIPSTNEEPKESVSTVEKTEPEAQNT